ncbi:tRNA (adenosine(37)-N6)-threonylcarbamoyltransferase complex ATPase subunit type 1 TsaE [Hutsoniella sourekii]
MEIITFNAEETKQLGALLSQLMKPGMVMTLTGDLGAGKTTLTQGFGKGLGIKRAIKSPTYTIVKEYPLEDGSTFIHMDAYRLEEGGADTVDLDQFLSDDYLILIEWPQFIEEYLPQDYLEVHLAATSKDNQRRIQIDSHSPAYSSIIDALKQKWKDVK